MRLCQGDYVPLEYRVNSKLTFEEACSKVPEVVRKKGFAVLAEIKTSDILKSKGFSYHDLRTYDICNAGFASKALAMGSWVETILPCRLVVKSAGDHTEISVQLPGEMLRAYHKNVSGEMDKFLSEVEPKLREIADSVANPQ